jgi:hypothetical protein
VVWQWQRDRGRRRRASPTAVGPAAAAPAPVGAPEPGSPGPTQVQVEAPVSGPWADPDFAAGLRPIPSGAAGAPSPWPAVDVLGVGPHGRPVEVLLDECDGYVLLAFLTTRCPGCAEFWREMVADGPSGLPAGVARVIVTRGPGTASPDEVSGLVAGGVGAPVVMSDQTWADYRVHGYPFFVLVEVGPRAVIGETVGFGWSDITSMVANALP